MEIILFALRESVASWYRSYWELFVSFKKFREMFLRHYHSDDSTGAKLTKLKTVPFNLKVGESVEKFVSTRYYQNTDLDPYIKKSKSGTALLHYYGALPESADVEKKPKFNRIIRDSQKVGTDP